MTRTETSSLTERFAPVCSLRHLRIGTRGSFLARTQSQWVAERLRATGLEVSLETISTRGDAAGERTIPTLGGDGVFVREIEQALLEGRIDAAVHSCKDLPTAEVPGLVIGSVPARELPFDVLVGPPGTSIRSLPRGAVVGTSSVRRAALLQALRPDVDPRPIRGNVDSRLRRLDEGEYHALILAGAGLVRLGLAARIAEVLEPPGFWPAVGQGALAIQIRDADADARAAVTSLDDPVTHLAVTAERACLAALVGGCLAPVGGWARWTGTGLTLGACVLEPTAETVACVTAEEHLDLPAPATAPTERSLAAGLGRRVAERLIAQGASAMISRSRDRLAAAAPPDPLLNQKS